jgi:DNA-damage-inducible protein D
MKQHNTQLADAAKSAGVVEPRDYAIFQNHGYMGLYGGLGAQEIHNRKGLKKSQQIPPPGSPSRRRRPERATRILARSSRKTSAGRRW